MLLVASCWVPCDGLPSLPIWGILKSLHARYPGDAWWTSILSRPGSSNARSRFTLGTLQWTSILSRGSSNTPSCFMLGTLWWLAYHPGGVVILLIASCWAPCDGLASHPRGEVILLVTSCWVPCDGLASILSRESRNAPSHFMLGTLQCLASYPGGVVILLVYPSLHSTQTGAAQTLPFVGLHGAIFAGNIARNKIAACV